MRCECVRRGRRAAREILRRWCAWLAFGTLSVMASAGATAAGSDKGPWPAPVAGFVEPKAGEHPRLFFRKADVGAIRRKARTPVGKRIVARLRTLLHNNGEALPKFSDHFPINLTADRVREGCFTIGHPAGYGLLYQLTGEAKYAQMARTCLERMFDADLYKVTMLEIKRARGKAWESAKKYKRFAYRGRTDTELAKIVITYGQPDMDPRFTWTRPGAGLRVGPMMYCVALAYDLCYDAWDDAFRRRVVKEILHYDQPRVDYDMWCEGGRITMAKAVDADGYIPGSNHVGMYLGGVGIALLAIRHDAGADVGLVDNYLAKVEENTLRLLTEGFGDRGYFAEGHGPGHSAANPSLIPFLQVARVAWGKDFIAPRPVGQWLTLRWAMEIVPDADGQAWYPNLHPSAYGSDHFTKSGFSDGGEWAQGFGALAGRRQVGAMLWTWQRSLGRKEGDTFGVWYYPHKLVPALVNWPVDVEPLNPGKVLPHAAADEAMGYFVFRKGWSGPDDVLFTFLLNPRGRHGWVRSAGPGSMAFWGLGLRMRWRLPVKGKRELLGFELLDDGGGTVALAANGEKSAVAVDFSGRSGAPAVVVLANCWATRERALSRGGVTRVNGKKKWSEPFRLHRPKSAKANLTRKWVADFADGTLLLLLHEGPAAEPQVRSGVLRLGEQAYRFEGGRIRMGG